MPATISHALSMTTPNNTSYENQPQHWNSAHIVTLNAVGSEISSAFGNNGNVTFGLSADGNITARAATTYRASNDAVGLNTAQTNVTWTVNSAGISFNAGGYNGTGFTSATTAGTNIVATNNTAGLSMGVPAFISTARGSTDAIGLNTANSNVTWTANSAGLSFDARGYAGTGTTFAGTNVSASMTVNSNGVNLAFSAGAGGAGGIAAGVSNLGNTAGSTGTVSTGNVVFVGSSGITLSQSTGAAGSNATITILGNGAAITDSKFEPYPLAGTSLSSLGNSSIYFMPFNLDDNLSISRFNMLQSMSSTSSASAVSIVVSHTYNAAVYTRNATDATRLDTMFSTQLTSVFAISSNGTMGVSFTGGNTVSGGIVAMSGFNGGRIVTGAFQTMLTPGEYFFAYQQMSTSAGSSVGMRISNVLLSNISNTTWGFVNQATANSANPRLRGFGVFSAASGGLPASVGLSQIFNGLGMIPYVNFYARATSQ